VFDVGIMIEGQDGLNWTRWKRLVEVVERCGFSSLYRSDHFTNPRGPDRDALELWASLTYLAGATSRIEFGPLVTPVTFRLPAITAKAAAAAHDLSGGRLILGIGAGWQDREHQLFGIPFPPAGVRLAMLEEYVQVVGQLMRGTKPVEFRGSHYQIDGAEILPHPHGGGPPILVGGNGEKRTLPIVARYADAWNAVFVTPARFRELSSRLDELLDRAERPRDAVRRSTMIGTIFGRSEDELRTKLAARGWSVEDARGHGLVAGTPAMLVEQLRGYREAGVERVMLQWLDQDDIEGLEIIGHEVLVAL